MEIRNFNHKNSGDRDFDSASGRRSSDRRRMNRGNQQNLQKRELLGTSNEGHDGLRRTKTAKRYDNSLKVARERENTGGHADTEKIATREDRLEGRNPVIEALRAGRQIDKIWVQAMGDGRRPEPTLAGIVNMAISSGAVVNQVPRSVLDNMSQTGAHQGVIAQAAVIPYVDIDEILAVAADKQEDPFIIIADEIQDSYNLGAILRTAESAGVHGVVFPKHRQVTLDAVTAKASAGAVNHVPCARVNNLVQTMNYLKGKGVWIAGLNMDGESIFDNKKMTGPIALVVGNEGKGISRLVADNCDFTVSIPMQGVLNSLNAAVATGIAVFETLRLRQRQ